MQSPSPFMDVNASKGFVVEPSNMEGASYDQMQELIIELQNELHSTINISMNLKQENNELSKDLNEIKDSKSRMAERFRGLREALTQQFEECSKRELELDKSESKWKAQLLGQNAQIRELQGALDTSKLDEATLRSELYTECGTIFDTKLSILEQEVGQFYGSSVFLYY